MVPVLLYEARSARTSPWFLSLLAVAVDMAIAYGMTVYDALYFSLAKVYETRMITADRKLVEALSRTDLRDSVTWLGSYL